MTAAQLDQMSAGSEEPTDTFIFAQMMTARTEERGLQRKLIHAPLSIINVPLHDGAPSLTLCIKIVFCLWKPNDKKH